MGGVNRTAGWGLAVPIVGFALLAVVVWSSLLPPQLVPVVAFWGVGCVGFLWQAGTAWWSRRIEAEADQYAAREGRLEALDEPSPLELLIGGPDTPAWRSTHPRWLDRIPVPSDRLPEGIRRMQVELDQAVARLVGGARAGRRRPHSAGVELSFQVGQNPGHRRRSGTEPRRGLLGQAGSGRSTRALSRSSPASACGWCRPSVEVDADDGDAGRGGGAACELVA